MNISITLEVPTLKKIPFTTAIQVGFGYIFGKIANSSPTQWVKIHAITHLAHSILFLIFSAPMDDLRKKRILHVSLATISKIAQIIALRHFNLIGTTGTLILGSLTFAGSVLSFKMI